MCLASFIARQAPAGVQRTRRQVKAKLRSQIIDCEAWAIACSIAEKTVFTNLKEQNASFCGLSTAVREIVPASIAGTSTAPTRRSTETSMASSEAWFQEDLGIACIQLAIPARACKAEEVEQTFVAAPCSSKY